jgi:hypothetical protein
MNPRIEGLRSEFDKVRTAIDSIDAADGADLTAEQAADSDKLFVRAEQIKAELEPLVARQNSLAATADVLARVTPSAPITTAPRDVKISAADFVATYGRAMLRGDQDAVETLQRTFATPTLANIAGVLPTPIVGDLINYIDTQRRITVACRQLPMPDGGQIFSRPRISTHASVALQSSPFTELSSTAIVLTGDNITKLSYGGGLDLSEQDIDWSSPALFQIVLEDLGNLYVNAIEQVAATAIESSTAAANDDVLSLTPTPTQFQAAIALGASEVFAASGSLPDTLFLSVDRWAYIAGLADSSGRPVYPYLNPQSAPGQFAHGVTEFGGDILGMKVVVSPKFSAGFSAVAVSRLCEVYEQEKGPISIAAPSTLSVRVAYRGYFAANIYAAGVVSFSPTGAG